MTRTEAIAIRTLQLGGQAVDQRLLAQAIQVIQDPSSAEKKRTGRPPGKKDAVKRPYTKRQTWREKVLLERANNALAERLKTATARPPCES